MLTSSTSRQGCNRCSVVHCLQSGLLTHALVGQSAPLSACRTHSETVGTHHPSWLYFSLILRR